MRILVAGARGMLGTDVCSVLGESHDVFGYDVGDFDITDAESVAGAVLGVSPAVIVHTAAFTDVEAREEKRLIDATQGRRTRSVIITDSNHVVLSAIQSETIAQRFSPSCTLGKEDMEE